MLIVHWTRVIIHSCALNHLKGYSSNQSTHGMLARLYNLLPNGKTCLDFLLRSSPTAPLNIVISRKVCFVLSPDWDLVASSKGISLINFSECRNFSRENFEGLTLIDIHGNQNVSYTMLSIFYLNYNCIAMVNFHKIYISVPYASF